MPKATHIRPAVRLNKAWLITWMGGAMGVVGRLAQYHGGYQWQPFGKIHQRSDVVA